jgi:hypothetical protein
MNEVDETERRCREFAALLVGTSSRSFGGGGVVERVRFGEYLSVKMKGYIEIHDTLTNVHYPLYHADATS